MELSNRMRKFMSVLVIFFIIVIIVGIIYGVNLLITKNVVDPCVNSAPGTFDNCCLNQNRGNHFDTVNQECVTIESPKGNPSLLPLVQVTDSNNNIITPPTGQDAMIVPEIARPKPEVNVSIIIPLTNGTQFNYTTNSTQFNYNETNQTA